MANRARSNSKSQLLSDQENIFVFNVLGKGCFTLATCVAQLFVVQCQKRKRRWIKQCCGVVCFVKDNPNKSYYIRLYDIQRQQLLWEQEIYTKFKYNTPKEFFHTFEAHDCHVGLNFASEDEAEKFKHTIEGKLLDRYTKRQEREDRKIENKHVTFAPADETVEEIASIPKAAPSIDTLPPEKEKNTSDNQPKMRKKSKRTKLTKEDVGVPADFRHVSHMSWALDDGPHMDRLDADMKALLEQIGIREKSQVDNDTMDFIYEFAEKHGGANAVREDFAWHIPAEPSHPADVTMDITKYHPSASSQSYGAKTNITQPPASPLHRSDRTAAPTRQLPAIPPGARLLPPSGVKVLDATSVIRPLDSSTASSTLHTKPPPTPTKPHPPSTKPPPTPTKPHPPCTKPPPPHIKPPPPSTKPTPPSIKPPSIVKPPIDRFKPKLTTTKSVTALMNPMSNHPHQRVEKHTPDHSTTIQAPVQSPNEQDAQTHIQAVPTSTNHLSHSAVADIRVPTDSTETSSTSAEAPSLSSSNSSALQTPPDIPEPPTDPPPVAIPNTHKESEIPVANSPRAGLLSEIHTFQGASLRHVHSNQDDSKRNGLLIQIRSGATLKHVEHSEEPPPAKRGSIAAALMSQLLKRKSKLQFSDDEYSSDEFDDDWDDD